jgi:hypothetical protein
MSFDIAPVERTSPAAASQPASSAPAGPGASDGPAASNEAVTVDTIPSTPPEEVLSEMRGASQAYEKLAKSDRHLHFRVDDRTGKLTVEVHDLKGNVLFTVPASKALEVAAGGKLQ